VHLLILLHLRSLPLGVSASTPLWRRLSAGFARQPVVLVPLQALTAAVPPIVELVQAVNLAALQARGTLCKG
jgi:hypothetical protein